MHNSHHAYITSAKFSSKWWELDIGWIYICFLELFRLAKVQHVGPKIRFEKAKCPCDAQTLRAVIAHRYDVLARFDKCSANAATRRDLAAVWSRPTATKEQLVKELEDWCLSAEPSSVIAIQEFSRMLR